MKYAPATLVLPLQVYFMVKTATLSPEMINPKHTNVCMVLNQGRAKLFLVNLQHSIIQKGIVRECLLKNEGKGVS